jgi:hypothetical protein
MAKGVECVTKGEKENMHDLPVNRQCFRQWVELRDLRDDTVRELPVTVFKRILLVAKKKAATHEAAPEIRLRVQDVGRIWEASDLKDLARILKRGKLKAAGQRRN